MDPKKTNDYFNRHNITYAFLPTKFAELFFKEKNQSLHYLIVAGEKLETFIKQSYHVINGYGPTEASVHTTSFLVNKPYHNIPIGKPINNVKCYVVDKNINPLPIGAIGELLIGGEGLARGYLNQSDLSAKKFVINPFQTNIEKQQNKNGRLYKTGDLVRQLPDGVLEYIGRNDFQVKIRGFRIELGEIEGKLKNYPKIKQSIVVVRENKTTRSNNKYLVAYYTADTKLDERKIRKDLSKHLPDYMLPSSLIYLDKIPFTVNGKVNIKALPNPMLNINENYVKPSNEQEEIICQAFSNILGTKNVSVHDDFFNDLGGSSLDAISLTTVLQNNFNIKVADIFKHRTPLQLAINSQYGENVLKQKLEEVKAHYANEKNKKNKIDQKLQNKLEKYFKKNSKLKIDGSLKIPIVNVLLTGGTGYLGCNILYQLLKLTSYKIYLLVRARTQTEAMQRQNKKFKFYFDETLDEVLNRRVFIIKSDIEDKYLGISIKKYDFLAKKIDSIIHSAALVKHYGEYAEFYSANVKSTINLLEFSKKKK